MKLAHYHIEHIKEWIGMQNIWYDEIKDELLDHMICSTEHKIQASEMKFIEALAEVCNEVKPFELQRQKLKYEHINSFKEVLTEMTRFSLLKSNSLVLTMSVLAFILFRTPIDNTATLRIYLTSSVLLVMLATLFYTYRHRANHPFSNVYFMAKMNGVCTTNFLIISLIQLLLVDWLIGNPFFLFVLFGLQSWYLFSGIRVLFQSFTRIKHAAH